MKKLLLLYLLFVSFIGLSQETALYPTNRLLLGANIKPIIGFSIFSQSGFIHPSINISSLPSLSGGVTIRKLVSNRWFFETGLNISRMGYSIVFTPHYQANQKWRDQNRWTSTFGIGEIPTLINYQFANSNQLSFYGIAGISWIFYASKTDVTVGSATSNNDIFNGSNFEQETTIRLNDFLKPTLMFGVGTERQSRKGWHYGSSLVFSFGVGSIAEWDYLLTVNDETFSNIIVNKGTYIGLTFFLLFPL